ncbi:MAG: sn-glycerol-3-phosphate ABC transporter ATP-binding protein UgpC [Paralcaligenes sp.]
MSSIRINNLNKAYGNVSVLKDINVDIMDGEFLALVGPSGCGKSTLLRVISGLESASSGEITIGARKVTSLPAKDRDIAMVFQNYALYPHMTVAENLGFSLKMRGEKKEAIEKRVNQVASTLGLDTMLRRKPRQLSGGQRQRVAMGRAIVRNPKAFLFDEPLSNLDAKLRVQMRTEIKSLHRKLKTTMVYVTHDQIEAMTMADRVVVMRDGIVEQIGEPLKLYDEPKNRFVAGFIGSPGMNLLDGTVVANPNVVFKLAGGGQLPLPAAAKKWEGRRLVYGIRPEDLTLDPAGLPAKVVSVEPTGSETYVISDANGVMLTCVLRERTNVMANQEVGLMPRLERLHLFNAESGERIVLPAADPAD